MSDVYRSASSEIHVNEQQPRWVDKLSHEQYGFLLAAAVIVPTITSVGIVRTIAAYRKHYDSKSRVLSGRAFLKSASAFNHKFYPYLLPKVTIGQPLPKTGSQGQERLLFPNLNDYRALGKGITQYNWRNGDIKAVQKSLQRVDRMKDQDLWTFTTLYTLMSNQKAAFELVDKIMRWVVKGEVQLDDLRASNVPDVAKWDLPESQRKLYESEGWTDMVLAPDRADAFAKRWDDAEREYRKKGGQGAFKMLFSGQSSQYTESAHSNVPTPDKRDI